MKKYDVIIIGGGIGGLMCAYRLVTGKPGLKIAIIEKGHPLEKRSCPVVSHKTKSCVKCEKCAIMEGMAGAGAFSDGKYDISTQYGGWLTDFIPDRTVIDYIEQADRILVSFGAVTERYQPDNELKKLCLRYDLHMLQAQLKHLEGFLMGVQKKLSNERFVANAPEAVVALERKKQSDAEEKIASLKESIAALR